MRKIRRLGLSLVLAVLLTLGLVVPALATNPTVTITISAQIVSITNSKANWDIGLVTEGQSKYFSTNNAQDDDWSTITNIGNVAVDVAIKGTNFEGGDYDWTIGAAAGNKTYSLFANTNPAPTVYNKEVTTGGTAWVSNLAKTITYNWSMNLIAPTWFDPADDGGSKTATVTLVTTKT